MYNKSTNATNKKHLAFEVFVGKYSFAINFHPEILRSACFGRLLPARV